MSIFFIRQMFVGLTDLDSNGKPIPSLATEWDVSDDGLEWTFNLRDDIYWVHRDPITGNYKKLRPVTAADVVYGVVRTLHPDTDSEYAYVLYIIEGAEELNNADPTSNDFESILSGIKVMALDDKTVVFRLRAPAAYFPSITSMPITYPQPQEVIKEKEHNWTEVGFIVTNGAYTVQEWKPNEQIILEKNVEWYDADNVEIELLSTRVVSDTAIALKLYKDGKIDFLSSSLIYQLQIIDEDDIPKSELYVIPKSCTEYYGFINSKPPFDNKLLRRAFSATINRELLIENVIKGEHIPANSFSAPGIFGSMAQNPAIGILLTLSYSERVTLAKSWLEEAGYPEGEGIEIVLGFNTSKMKKQVAEEVRRMWLDAFPNATITLKEYEWSDYIATLKQDTPDDIKPNIYRLGWCADYPDANNFLNDVFHSKSKQNLAKYSNPDFDKIIEQAASEKDSGERMKLYFQAEAIFINQDTAIAPIYYHTSVYLHKSWLTGVVFDQFSVDTIAKWRINWDEKRSIGTFISLLPHPERPEGTGPIP
ncbi:MAG: hypothetical protein B6242_15790 [Anaerolineaceae bacterium 4572_78]|nr:MAG: hypothetical protein B6242_15790 [Anaerolineaceae bacterium 4572_78]